MGGDSAKRLLKENQETLRKNRLVIFGVSALYLAYRVAYLWETLSGWHIAGATLLMAVNVGTFWFLSMSASPKYAPLAEGGKLISAGVDLSQSGVIEYTWDLLYVNLFVQLTSGFVSDWFWLLYLIPPSVGFYYLWTKLIYPWISKPDAEPEDPSAQGKKQKVKYGKAH